MVKDPDKKTAKNGLEIDKINLSNIPANDTSKAVPAADQAPSPPPEKMPRNRNVSILAVAITLAGLALFLGITVFFKQQDLTFDYLSGTTDSSLENYLRVGPVTATLANEDIVKFSIDIDCGNADLKTQLTEKDTQIRDKIVSVLTAPETEELIKKRDYEAIKAILKESLGDMGLESIRNIYVADLLMY